ncbi:hypothetical protein TWF696_005501 [Orbilia brochopaga]|uniref:Uncharacterized protein n=1 Tax=Orbilia brochopaga TaxID=3140254 RepID=A0AAV9V1C5_9PEZI
MSDSDTETKYTFGNFIKEAFLNALGIWIVLAILTFTGIQKRLDDWAIRKCMEWRGRRLQRRREREVAQGQAQESGISSAATTEPVDAQMTEVGDVGNNIILSTITAQNASTMEGKAEDGVELTEEDRIPVEQATDYGTQG